MLHAQDSHAMEPHSCHRFPTANDETDRPELKLVTFECPTAAGKRLFHPEKANPWHLLEERAAILRELAAAQVVL